MNRAQRACYRAVRERLAPGASILEASCGAGQILAQLHADGYVACGTNYSRYAAAPLAFPVTGGVDLREPLPFKDASFDGMILCDVIEHVSDHPRLISEAARVVRPGGLVVVLTPNTNRLSSRVHFLFSGIFKLKRAFVGFDVPPDKAFTFHNYPPHLPVFLYQMHSHGLPCVTLGGVGLKAKNVILWLMLAPFVVGATLYTFCVHERNLKRSRTGWRLFRELVSFPALCAESWVSVHGRRGAEADEAHRPTRLPEWHVTS